MLNVSIYLHVSSIKFKHLDTDVPSAKCLRRQNIDSSLTNVQWFFLDKLSFENC